MDPVSIKLSFNFPFVKAIEYKLHFVSKRFVIVYSYKTKAI